MTIFDQAELAEGKLEKVMSYIPFLGWAVSSGLWRRRHRPIQESITQNLAGRPFINRSIWGDAERQEIAAFVCTAIKEQIGWPNDRYLPADAVGVLMWSFQDCLESVEIVMQIEDRFGFKLPDEEFELIFRLDMSEFVDLISTRSVKPVVAPESSPGDLSPS